MCRKLYRETSSRGQHRSFPTSAPLTRRPTSNYPQTRHHWDKCPEPRAEATAPSWSRQAEKGERSGCTLTTLALPRGWHSITPTGPSSLWLPQRESESPRWTSSFSSRAGCFTEVQGGPPAALVWHDASWEAHSGLTPPWSLWESLGEKRKTSTEQ